MKLTNPTDDQLNACFAEKVAGWMRAMRLGKEVLYDPEGGHVLLVDTKRHLPDYCRSADAVLPWLEKLSLPVHGSIYRDSSHWSVSIISKDHITRDGNCFGVTETFAKSLVIALLRAHGVEIEFT